MDSGWVQSLDPAEYDIEFCQNSTAAVQAALTGDFEAVLVGEKTFGPDATTFLRRLREAEAQARVIVLSDAPTIESAVAAMKEGAFDYLRRPARGKNCKRP